MKLGKISKKVMTSFDMEFTRNEIANLVSFGLKHIKKDTPALINYTVNKILTEYMEKETVLRGKNDK